MNDQDKTAVIIPAVKKNVAFNDDLVKKLAGVSLIQRAIHKACEITRPENIFVVTDSAEIRLICQRNRVKDYYKKDLKLQPVELLKSLNIFLIEIGKDFQDMILLSPYAPLLKAEEIQSAFRNYLAGGRKLLVPVKREVSRAFQRDSRRLDEVLFGECAQEFLMESQAFQIFSNTLIQKGCEVREIVPLTYELNHDLIEIRSYQDWWVVEKLLKRKRIVFRVIGNERVGMGHIYRALTLAHEITDHEVRFVCDEESRVAALKLAGYDYWLGIYKDGDMVVEISALRPDLVINDILNTDRSYVQALKKQGIRVINFEDLGDGAAMADVTVNELFDESAIQGENILWGHDYFFLREEFHDAKPNAFAEQVKGLLISFGGTDPSDFTRKFLPGIVGFCGPLGIRIFVVTGGGYPHIRELEATVSAIREAEIEYLHSTGVMSHIMEQVQVAITSNGRTVYELAHMNIPSIVLSHHARENTHLFATEKNGFFPLGLYEEVQTEKRMMEILERLVRDTAFRKSSFDRLMNFSFHENKKKVLELIEKVLENEG